MGQALLAYMSIVSIVLLILMGMDKSRAKNMNGVLRSARCLRLP